MNTVRNVRCFRRNFNQHTLQVTKKLKFLLLLRNKTNWYQN